jgi:hypothetical protein
MGKERVKKEGCHSYEFAEIINYLPHPYIE